VSLPRIRDLWQFVHMRMFAAVLVFLCPMAAGAAEVTSSVTNFDLARCKMIEPADQYVHAGTWACKGFGAVSIVQSSTDDRSYAAFGQDGMKHCSFRKTFSPFNTALSPVEWRIKGGKAFAAIERWSVVKDDRGHSVTWLVVNALRKGDSCHVHYVSGSYPDANIVARRAADRLAAAFDCGNDVPTFESEVGAPPIDLISCKDLAEQQ
jgi:hypothetical protein